jgi:hypothetical protein
MWIETNIGSYSLLHQNIISIKSIPMFLADIYCWLPGVFLSFHSPGYFSSHCTIHLFICPVPLTATIFLNVKQVPPRSPISAAGYVLLFSAILAASRMIEINIPKMTYIEAVVSTVVVVVVVDDNGWRRVL